MALGLGKRAIGVFPNRQDTEYALNELKNSDFPMDKVSVVAREASEDDEMASSPSEFVPKKTVEGLGKGALAGGAVGGIGGGLVAGLASLAVPGLGSVVLAGAHSALAGVLAGGFYGTVAGGIIGTVMGNGISQEQANVYDERLSNGDYVVMIDGTDDEIHCAESVLKAQGVQEWGIYSAT
ncbi:MAG: signal transduction histidine kinase LytS [Cyanobacteriota bacterium]|nr:signal transduction histidine kinase LytS [Cyanobacteriota bacterium]